MIPRYMLYSSNLNIFIRVELPKNAAQNANPHWWPMEKGSSDKCI